MLPIKSMQSIHSMRILVCSDCKHYNGANRTCKALSIVNNVNGAIKPITTLQCRTNEAFCGIEAKLFEDRNVSKHSSIAFDDDSEYHSYAEYCESLANLLDDHHASSQ